MSFKQIYIGFVLVFIGCVSSLYIPTDADAVKSKSSVKMLNEGRELYVSKCNGCHNLYLPSQFSAEGWKINVESMQKPAKIDDVQKELIYRYLSVRAE